MYCCSFGRAASTSTCGLPPARPAWAHLQGPRSAHRGASWRRRDWPHALWRHFFISRVTQTSLANEARAGRPSAPLGRGRRRGGAGGRLAAAAAAVLCCAALLRSAVVEQRIATPKMFKTAHQFARREAPARPPACLVCYPAIITLAAAAAGLAFLSFLFFLALSLCLLRPFAPGVLCVGLPRCLATGAIV